MKRRRWLQGPALAMAVAFSASAVAAGANLAGAQTAGDRAAAKDASPHLRLLERIVAVVDEDPIFHSDLERAERWAPMPKPSRRELLDALVDERVRVHEVDRRGGAQAREEDVARQLESAPPELDREALEPLVRRQLRVLAYVEERLGALVFISDEAVLAYYEGTLREEMLRQGSELPSFDEVRGAIRALLRQKALERRIVAWTQELRAEAEIQDWLEEPLALEALPRPSWRLEPTSNVVPEEHHGDLHPDRP